MTIDFSALSRSKTAWSALAMLVFALTGLEISVVVNGQVFAMDKAPEVLALVGVFWGRMTAKGPLVGKGGGDA